MPLGIFEFLFLFSPLVLVPLVLLLIDLNGMPVWQKRLQRLCKNFQPVAGLFLAASFFQEQGEVAGILALPWLIETLLMAWLGLVRISQQKFKWSAIIQNIALIYISVGGGWLMISRLGLQPLGFSDTIVFLTAIHFHYAGFVAPVLAGKILSQSKESLLVSRLSMFTATGIVIATPLLAAGITFSPQLEVIAATLFIVSLVCLSVFNLWFAKKMCRQKPLAALLFAISALSSLFAMTYAGVFAYSEFVGQVIISIPQMARTHGIANALGFSFCGLLAWVLFAKKDGAIISFLQPDRKFIDDILSLQQQAPFSYDAIGFTREGKVPAGYANDQHRVCLGKGQEVFARAKLALQNWQMFPTGWITLHCRDVPIREGELLCAFIRVLGIWFINVSRIVYVFDEKTLDSERFGFAYGTLGVHAERGEERFCVTWTKGDDTVWYEISAFSQTCHALARLAKPYTRWLQKRFGKASLAAMNEFISNS